MPRSPKYDYDPRSFGARCDICPLRSKRVVPPNGPGAPVIAIVGEGPGENEEREGRGFVGPSGQELDRLLDEVGLDRAAILITNAILCRCEIPNVKGRDRFNVKDYMAWLNKENASRKKQAKAIKKPYEAIPSPFECCKPRLMAELAMLEENAREFGLPNGALVIPMGNFALKAITGKDKIGRWRGSPIGLRVVDGSIENVADRVMRERLEFAKANDYWGNTGS